jgi:hypothetical protein
MDYTETDGFDSLTGSKCAMASVALPPESSLGPTSRSQSQFNSLSPNFEVMNVIRRLVHFGTLILSRVIRAAEP